MVNTCQGPQTRTDALNLFIAAKLHQGSLLGILNQLKGFLEYEVALEHVRSHPLLYSLKICKLAQEKSVSAPIVDWVINSRGNLAAILQACGRVTEVRITIHKGSTDWRLRQMLMLENLQVDAVAKAKLIAAANSGKWNKAPRTFTAVVSLTSDAMLLKTGEVFLGVVAKVEIKSIIEEHSKFPPLIQPLSVAVKVTLAANPNVFYDRELFLKLSKDLGYIRPQELIGNLPEDPTLSDALGMFFFRNTTRIEFLKDYITAFNAAVGVT